MNRENLIYMRGIMEHATCLNMTDYQIMNSNDDVKTVEALHACGNTACFAGYVGLSAKFQADGGGIEGFTGVPYINNNLGENVLVEWLGISEALAKSIVYGYGDLWDGSLGVNWEDAKPKHIVKLIDMILAGEIE